MERRLFKVGYGKYEFMVVAEDERQAVDIVATREKLSYMPLEVKEEITKIDGYNVLLVTDEELAEAEEQPVEDDVIEGTLMPEGLEEMKKDELVRMATEMEIEINDKMTKKDIIELISKEKILVNKSDIVE